MKANNVALQPMGFLEVSDIGKQQGSFSMANISFTQQQYERVAIAGVTGSGKSTLMKLIGGLADADSGTIHFEGRKVTGPAYNLIPGHPGIAYLSQRFELRNHYRMEELLSYANNLTDEAAARIFSICRIDHLLKRRTDGLSGGEQQRIALARLLVGTPKLLLLDEPFSNLDLIYRNTLKEVIAEVGTALGISIMLISHDPGDILSWADTLLVMKDGALLQKGSPEDIYHRPADAYAAGLLGSYNLFDTSLFGKGQPGRKLFIRPEHIKLSPDGVYKGLLENALFYGSYYELLVSYRSRQLKIKVPELSVSAGAEVAFNLQDKYIHYL